MISRHLGVMRELPMHRSPSRGNAAAITCASSSFLSPARRLARSRNTHDTNRSCGDTRTIRWLARIARSETSQMLIFWLPKRRPLSEWWHETVPTGIRSPRTRIVSACSGAAGYQLSLILLFDDLAWKLTTSQRLWDGRGRPLRGRSHSMHGNCSSVTRLVRLIFRFKSPVADRSCRHGYAP